MGLYEEIKDYDLLVPAVCREIEKGSLRFEEDGKIHQVQKSGFEPESPWLFVGDHAGRHCRKWMLIYFNLYGIISRNCFNCWKVVVRPKSLEDLVKLRKLQKKLNLSGKCGVEQREENRYKGWYEGFWYCSLDGGLEGARRYHKGLELEVKNELGFQNNVILKRACTEMENRVGPSDKWAYPKVQDAVEDALDELFVIDHAVTKQPELLKLHIIRRWIEYAWSVGDETVRKFSENQDLSYGVIPTVTYQERKGLEPEQPARESKGSQRALLERFQDYL